MPPIRGKFSDLCRFGTSQNNPILDIHTRDYEAADLPVNHDPFCSGWNGCSTVRSSIYGASRVPAHHVLAMPVNSATFESIGAGLAGTLGVVVSNYALHCRSKLLAAIKFVDEKPKAGSSGGQ